MAFGRNEKGEYRIDAAIAVASEKRARSLAAELAKYARGTVVLSMSGDPLNARQEDPEILAQFGQVPDDGALRDQLRLNFKPGRLQEIAVASRLSTSAKWVARLMRRSLLMGGLVAAGVPWPGATLSFLAERLV